MASKKIEIGNRRYVVVKKDEIRLCEDGSNKCATFTYPRWANFVKQFDKIDQSIAANDGGVKLQLHIGGGWFVSVTSYVDICKFCHPPRCRHEADENGYRLAIARMVSTEGGRQQDQPPLPEGRQRPAVPMGCNAL